VSEESGLLAEVAVSMGEGFVAWLPLLGPNVLRSGCCSENRDWEKHYGRFFLWLPYDSDWSLDIFQSLSNCKSH
jgi:hypothetical protein